MDKHSWLIVTLVILWFAAGALFGYATGIVFERKPLQDAAVERGYAEWAVPAAGRGNTVFQWVD